MSGNIGKRTDAEIANYMAVKDGRKSRYSELFGTPERAARTFADFCHECDKGECNDCPLDRLTDFCIGYDALLEWLRGDTE